MFIVPILIYVIVKNNIEIKSVLFLSFFFFLPYSTLKAKDFIKQRKDSFKLYTSNKKYFNKINKFKNDIKINDNHEINILTNIENFKRFDTGIFYSFLPVSKNKIPFLYLTNICEMKALDSVKYKIHKKLEINYILSDTIVEIEKFKLVNNTNEYFLYENTNIK